MLEYLDFQTLGTLFFWAVILIRAFQLRSFQLFPIVYFNVGVQIVSLLLTLAGASVWGLDDPRFVNLYVATEIAIRLATAFLLIWLISLPDGLQPVRNLPWMTCFLVVSAVHEFYVSPESHFILRLSRASGLFLLLMSCQALYCCLKPVNFEIGRSLGFVLGAVFLMLLLDFVNSSLYLTRLWDYQDWTNLYDFVGVAAWGAIAWGLWEVDKPKWGH